MFEDCAMPAFPRRVWLMEMDGHRREESRAVCGCKGNFGAQTSTVVAHGPQPDYVSILSYPSWWSPTSRGQRRRPNAQRALNVGATDAEETGAQRARLEITVRPCCISSL